jgi:DNA-binding Lrp family transcriptional regulator
MPKSSREQIKEDEKKVIRQLATNANESIDRIAKSCGFSRQKVWRIMKRLEENNTIWGYTAIVDHEKQNLNSYIVLIKKTSVPLGDTVDKIIARELEKHTDDMGVHISWSLYLNGIYDWMICFTAGDIKQAKKFCNVLTTVFKDSIAEVHLLEDIFTVKKQGILNPELEKLKEFKLPEI